MRGHRVRGERTEGYQALRCPACGEGVFVLPRSPLPEPVAPARPRGAKAASLGAAWVDEGPVALTDPARVAFEVEETDASLGEAEIIWEEPTDEPTRRDDERRGRDKADIADDRSAEPDRHDYADRPKAKGAPETPVRRRKKRSPETSPDAGSPERVDQRR